MRRPTRVTPFAPTRPTVRLALAAGAALALVVGADTAEAQYTVYGLSNVAGGAQQLVTFNSATPGAVIPVGLTGATLVGLDFRPATGVLYGRSTTRLYSINLTTGLATDLGAVGPTTGDVGFDFNPTVDRIRVTDGAGTNQRLNQTVVPPVTIPDGPFTYAPGSVQFAGQAAAFTGVGYTNSDRDPGTGTTLYGIDSDRGYLTRIAQPNGGDVFSVGSLGLVGGTLATNGFDIVLSGGQNFAFLAAFGTNTAGASSLYAVNLTSGAATLVGDIGVTGAIGGIAIAAVPEPGTWALLATGLLGTAIAARRRRTA